MSTTEIIMRVQAALGIQVDGIAGPKTWNAIASVIGAGPGAASHQPSNTNPHDARSEANIGTLIAPVQEIAREFLIQLNGNIAPYVAKIISGTRSYDEQDALYAQGRTLAGPVVTNARGGYSNHNFGIAFDIGIFDNKGGYLEDHPLYAKAGDLGKSLGLEWGGDWHFQDDPHFEWRPTWAINLSENALLSELRARKMKGQAIA